MSDTPYLDPTRLRARRDARGQLVVSYAATNDERGPRGDRRESGGAGYESGGAGKTTNSDSGALVVGPGGDRSPSSFVGERSEHLTADGVRPVRAFPFTAPEEQIALIDAEDREIGLIRDLGELDAESREAILAELTIAYLVPRVTGIRSVRSRFGITTWDLETDRGPRVAHVKERTDIRLLPDGRTMLTDVHGVQYEIPPRDEIEERSRFWLDFES